MPVETCWLLADCHRLTYALAVRIERILHTGLDRGLHITFDKVPDPKTVKNRLHLDLISDTFDAETERLLSPGPRG